MTQDEFDSLAIFVAVAEELRHEPFFSEDVHEKLGGDEPAVFCHPMFLKSAVLPFRKIWMDRERCAFRKRKGNDGIRELVFREHPDKNLLRVYHYWFYDHFDNQLIASFSYGWARESKQEIIDLWLNTQVAHTGPRDFTKKQKWERDLADFNACDARIGREKFEFLFRSSVGTVGHSYIAFEEILAFPLFNKLRDEGMKPSFEADVALKYRPYPDPKYNIRFDDVFWHLNRETMKDSFCRILARQRYEALKLFLHFLFNKAEDAVDCVNKSESLEVLLNEANVTILNESQNPNAKFKGCFEKNTFLEIGRQPKRIKLDAFEGPKIRFYNDSQKVLSGVYIEFLAALKKARLDQRRPDKW